MGVESFTVFFHFPFHVCRNYSDVLSFISDINNLYFLSFFLSLASGFFFFLIFASFLEEPDFVLEEQNQKILLIFCIDFHFFEACVLIMMCH